MSISVIIPTYNRAETVVASVLSVVYQSFFLDRSYEVIVVDDGSTDKTLDILRGLEDDYKQLKVISTGGRKGANYARNLGFENSVGDVVFFQDSDDYWLPNKVEIQMAPFLDESVGAVFCSLIRCGARVAIYPDFLNFSSGVVPSDAYRKFMRKNPVSTQCLAIRRGVFESLGRFDVGLPRFQDWDLTLRMLGQVSIYYVDQPLVVVNDTPGSITKNFSAGVRARRLLLDKHHEILSKHGMLLVFWLDYSVRALVAWFRRIV